jgi:antitoxin component of MazEF toxin-antitoxin module
MSTDATPQEIYDVIKGVVEDNYHTYKKQTENAYELLALLNGNGKGHLTCDKDDTSEECKESWSNFWEEPSMPPWGHSDLEYAIHYSDKELDAMCTAAEVEQDMKNIGDFLKQDRNSNFPGENAVLDRVKKWILPVEEEGDDCVITFPNDLLEAANLKEGDQIQWIPQSDGSCILKKVEVKTNGI